MRFPLSLAVALGLGFLFLATSPAAGELDPKQQVELYRRARAYFDLEQDHWKSRKDFREMLDQLTGSPDDLLKNPDALQKVLYQGRSFLEDLADKGWQKSNDVRAFEESGPYRSLYSETLRFTYVLPEKYPKKDKLSALPRPEGTGPYPLLFSLHEAQDFKGAGRPEKMHPGRNVLERRYPKSGEFAALYRDWLFLAPVTSRAEFLKEDGSIREDMVTNVLAQFWRRYHVDFDRIFLDGTEPAIAAASSQPNFYAGMILWGGKVPDPDLVRNFATLPVYCVDKPDLKKALEEAGHADVTVGPATGIPAWLEGKSRKSPKKFRWTAKRSGQDLANWIFLQQSEAVGATRTLDVEVKEGNRIEIAAKGVSELRVYLNDRIVDLDKEVVLVVNGKETKAKLERRFEELFEEQSLRKGMYLGWLYPSGFRGVKVSQGAAEAPPAPPAKPTDKTEGSPAGVDPVLEEKATLIWEKATTAEEAGDLKNALQLYQKVAAVGETSKKASAQAKVTEISAKLAETPGGK